MWQGSRWDANLNCMFLPLKACNYMNYMKLHAQYMLSIGIQVPSLKFTHWHCQAPGTPGPQVRRRAAPPAAGTVGTETRTVTVPCCDGHGPSQGPHRPAPPAVVPRSLAPGVLAGPSGRARGPVSADATRTNLNFGRPSRRIASTTRAGGPAAGNLDHRRGPGTGGAGTAR